MVSIIIYFSLRCRLVSPCLTWCDVTQDQGFHSAAYTCWMFATALLYVIEWAVLYSVIDETIHIYKLKKINKLALCHYLNQCWHTVNRVLWHSFHGNIYLNTMMTSSNGTFSALLALCPGNSPVIGEFPFQRPVTRSFDVFFELRLNERLSKHS